MLYHNFYFDQKVVTYIYQFKSNSIETNKGTLERHGYFGQVESGVLNQTDMNLYLQSATKKINIHIEYLLSFGWTNDIKSQST